MNSNYHLTKTYPDGATITFPLDGDETITTTCSDCGEAHELELDVFMRIVGRDGCDIYGTSVKCRECSKG